MRRILHFFHILLLLLTMSASAQTLSNLESYTVNSKWQKLSAWQLLEFYPFRGNETVLDIGSADGKTTASILQHVPKGRVVGLDYDIEHIKFAKKRYYDGQNRALEFVVGDAHHLPFQSEFDLVTSFTAAHLFEDQDKFLEGVHRALKPGGRLLMQFPIAHGFGPALDRTMQHPRWAHAFEYFHPGWFFQTPEAYRQLLQANGFAAERLEITTLDETYPSVDAFSESISCWLPQLTILNEAEKQEFMADLMHNYLEFRPLDKRGVLHFIVDRLEVQARKNT